MSIFLGIDPGTALTGWGIVEGNGVDVRLVAYGVIRTPAKQPLSDRLLTIYQEMQRLLDTYQPDQAAVEQVFFRKNVSTALSVGHARGVVLLALAQARVPLVEFKPTEVKQAITGYGGADKRQMQEMVRLLLGMNDIPRPDDAADALAIAICCHNHVGARWS
nr:crossover junction endodeoxyribonuclease RuvC [Ardenticatena sp.]